MVTKRGLFGSSIYLYRTTYLNSGYGHWKRDVLSRWLETGTATIAASIWTLDPEHDCFDSGHCSHMLRSALFEAASPLLTDKPMEHCGNVADQCVVRDPRNSNSKTMQGARDPLSQYFILITSPNWIEVVRVTSELPARASTLS